MIRRCPATDHAKVTMTARGFGELCRATRKRFFFGNGTGNEYCEQVCKGEIKPPGLTIQSIKTMQEKRKMSKGNRGTCDYCGEKNLLLRQIGNRNACGKCSTMHSNCRNWLPVIEQALVELYPEKYGKDGVEKVVTGEQSASIVAMQERIDALEEMTAAYSDTLAAIRTNLGIIDPDADLAQKVADLAEQLVERVEKSNALLAENIKLTATSTEKDGEIIELKRQLAEVGTVPPVVHPSLDSQLLDLLLAHPEISTERIVAIRRAS